MQLFGNKAQGAIEYLLIIGAAILVVAIVTIAVTSILGQGQNQASSGAGSANDSFDQLKETSGNYTKVNGQYYLNSSPLVTGVVTSLHLDTLNPSGSNFVAAPNGVLISDGFFGPGLQTTSYPAVAYSLKSENTSFDSSVGFSVSFWFKGDAYSDNAGGKCEQGFVASMPNNVYYTSVPAWSISQCIYSHLNQAVLWATDGSLTCCAKPQLIIHSNKVIRDGSWHNVVFTLKTNSLDENAVLYVDGAVESFDSPKNYFPGDVKTSSVFVSTNQRNNVDYLKGTLDEIVFWNKALTPAEVKELYTNSLAN